MFGQTYTTPEGFELPKPLLMPDARTFADVLDYLGEWNHETMSHHAGELPLRNNRPAARYLPACGAAAEWVRGIADVGGLPADPPGARNEIGPYCSVDLSQLGGPRFRGIAVRATDAAMEAVSARGIVTPDDHLSFQVIGHQGTGRALVILSHGYISGSMWLAYIDPATIPAYPFAERDRRAREIHDAMRDAGLRPVQRTTRDHSREYLDGHGGPLRARIEPDGTVTRTWTDGTVTTEPAGGLP